jgi:hypothetical protein
MFCFLTFLFFWSLAQMVLSLPERDAELDQDYGDANEYIISSCSIIDRNRDEENSRTQILETERKQAPFQHSQVRQTYSKTHVGETLPTKYEARTYSLYS